MVVNQIAQLAGVPAHVVRYYSRIGLLNPGRNPANGYKTFAPDDVARLRFIRLARRLGYSLTDISAILATVSAGGPIQANLQTVLRQRLAEHLEQMRHLAQQLICMERALRRWPSTPDDTSSLRELNGFLETLLDEAASDRDPEPTAKDPLDRWNNS